MQKKARNKMRLKKSAVGTTFNKNGKPISKKRAKKIKKWQSMSPEKRSVIWNARVEKHKRQQALIEYLVSRIFKAAHLQNEKIRWMFYKLYMFFCRWSYIIKNRLEINGLEHMYELKKSGSGAIFLLNHIGNNDVNIFMSSMSKYLGSISIFTDVGRGYFPKVLERYFNIVSRTGEKEDLIKKWIDTIKYKNKYFANWPEGTIRHGMKIVEPFSGIIRVYDELNNKIDRIPLVDVVLRGSNKTKYLSGSKKFKKVIVNISKPYYIPRSWLYGGDTKKSQREIINIIMGKMNKRLGYDELAPNAMLEMRRKNYQESKNPKWNM